MTASAVGLARATDRLSTRSLAPSAAAGTVSVVCAVGLMATSAWLITRASLRPPVLSLSIAIGLVQAFALGRGIARYLQRLAVHDVSLGVLGKLRLRLFDTLEPLVPGGLGGGGTGEVLSGMVADVDLVAGGFARTLTASVDVAAAVALGAVVVCLVQPVVGAVLVAGSLAVVATAVATDRLGRAGAEREALARAELAHAVVETMRAAPELVAFGRDDIVRRRLDEAHRHAATAATRRAVGAGAGRAAVTWVAGAAVVAVVAAGVAAHDAGHLSGVMTAVAAFVALAVLDQCASLSPALADGGGGAARRIVALGSLEPGSTEPVHDASGGATVPCGATLEAVRVEAAAGAGGAGGPTATGAGDGTPTDVGDRTILRDVSLRLAPGGRMGIVGPSGSGKTTVLHALLHFVECAAGRASIGGVDVRTMTRTGIAAHAGWMEEQTYVFADTLAANLRIARPSAGDAECVAVLRRVGLGTWFDALADGLDTLLGAGGRPVSAGERQRIGMARALLAGGTLLLLDEPTAHVDATSAAGLLADLLGAAEGRSVLVVGHDPSACGWVDDVVALEEGRVLRSRTAGSGEKPHAS